jgi:alkylated DNA nucleotide flippase Atl1/GNAT superfamily N-acetyltransferase
VDPERYVEAVLSLVEQVPPGRVTTYGAIAASIGTGGPRQVGRVMALHGGPVPWWRIVRADGRPPPCLDGEGAERYRQEGTPLLPSGRLDLARAFWSPEEGAGHDAGWTTRADDQLESQLVDRLVDHNKAASQAIRSRFTRGNLASQPVQAYRLEDGTLVGGCVGRVERVWHWLTVDTMWVDEHRRGTGLGAALLHSVEEQARELGCRWSEVTTFDFQAPGFYRAQGYVEYAVKHDYPPGHSNHLMRKDL